MQIRQKLLLGFFSIAALVVVAGAVGLYTSNRIGNAADRISDRNVPIKDVSMEAIISLQEGQNAAQAVLAETDGIDELAGEIEQSIVDFDMWITMLLHGSDSDAFGRSEAGVNYRASGADIVVPAVSEGLRPIVEEADVFHEEFSEQAVDLVEERSDMLRYYFDYEGRNWNIEDFVTLVELQHLTWIDDLGTAARQNAQFTGQTDPTQCFFGRWFYNYSVDDPEVVAILAELEPLHTALHEGAVAINQRSGSASKLAIYNAQTTALKVQIREKFDELSSYLGPRLAGMREEQTSTVGILNAAAANTASSLEQLELLVDEQMAEGLQDADAAQTTGIAILIAVVLVSVGAAIAIGLLIARSISKPLKRVTDVSEQIAAGDFQIENVEVKSNDEIGQLSRSFQRMLNTLKEKVQALKAVADGDLTIEVERASVNDELGEAMETMLVNLRRVVQEVQDASNQVASGSDQIASSSQMLSSGATEQASSIEEISASVNQISAQSRQNAEGAGKASELAHTANGNAKSGDEQMGQLRAAMQNISDSSEEIRKVVKVIDDIAFQINLLALNANVEAARAGKYGKGFAVVAEEVRNLATRSAAAVQETAAMVDKSVSNISDGNRIAEETGTRLGEIVTGISNVAQVLEEIAASSREQAEAVEQVTEGLSQVDEVTQSNTSAAEESAAAAEELASQAQQLIKAASVFRLSGSEQPVGLPAPESDEVAHETYPHEQEVGVLG